MACVRDERSFSLTEMQSTLRVRPDDDDEDHEKKKKEEKKASLEVSAWKSMAYRIEKVFPVYAMANFFNLDSGLAEEDCIWEAVQTEAKLEAEKEPILSSFLYASIMSHNCLEHALGFALANRLQNPVLLATQLIDIFNDVMLHDRGIQRSIRLDMQAFKDRDPSCLSYCWVLLYLKEIILHKTVFPLLMGIQVRGGGLKIEFTEMGYHSLQSYRVAHALWNKGRKVLALALQSRISEVFGVDIHPAAKIGDGILLDHATGVVIGETAVVGNRVSLMQGVTLGGTGKETGDRHPKIGQGALIGASTRILGNIKIGEGAMVAAGSLVLQDIPPHSMVAGVPAKVVGYVEEPDPSLTMKHDAAKGFCQHVAASSIDRSSVLNDGEELTEC